MTPTARPGRPVTLSPRDLYFASHHQAAHIVVAMSLGCRVDHMDVAWVSEEPAWCLDTVPSSDAATICAAGYAMELLLGRRNDAAWDNSKPDRALLANHDRDRDGIVLDSESAKVRFKEGAALCESLLAHPGLRAKIDGLAESLSDAYGAGEGRLSNEAMQAVKSSLTGMANAEADKL